MAKLEFQGKPWQDESSIKTLLAEHGILYERWPVYPDAGVADDLVLHLYRDEVARLKSARGYQSVDLVALQASTPNLDVILAKFDKEHHHSDDEVRFTVAGAGVFEIRTKSGDWLKFTAEPGDLIAIPAFCRHLFYLTSAKHIRCIRLFVSPAGWEAIYQQPSNQYASRV